MVGIRLTTVGASITRMSLDGESSLQIAEQGVHAKCWEDRFKAQCLIDGDDKRQDDDWYGNVTLKEAVSLARYGWQGWRERGKRTTGTHRVGRYAVG